MKFSNIMLLMLWMIGGMVVSRQKLLRSIVSSIVTNFISGYNNLVPPVLHITLGIVLKVFNMLVEMLRVKTLHQPRNDESDNMARKK